VETASIFDEMEPVIEAASMTETVPLATGEDGAIRVSGTRVLLDLIVAEFKNGATPEEIALATPWSRCRDVHHVLAYYLRHGAEIDEYIENRRQEGERVQRIFEAKFDPVGIRDRLLARQRPS
jgi:uncharacterized protein (DUF433 family)